MNKLYFKPKKRVSKITYWDIVYDDEGHSIISKNNTANVDMLFDIVILGDFELSVSANDGEIKQISGYENRNYWTKKDILLPKVLSRTLQVNKIPENIKDGVGYDGRLEGKVFTYFDSDKDILLITSGDSNESVYEVSKNFFIGLTSGLVSSMYFTDISRATALL